MGKEIAELKKNSEACSKLKQAQAVTTSPTSYWDEAFSCHEDTLIKPKIGDTCASSHMYGDESCIENLQHSSPVSISVASKDGHITTSKKVQVKIDSIKLQNFLHYDKSLSKLISIGCLSDKGRIAVFRRTEGAILDEPGKVVICFEQDPMADRMWHPVRRYLTQSAHINCADSISTEI